LLAEKPIPKSKYYGNFCQLEDGVGSLRMTLDDFYTQKLPNSVSKPYKICFACSYAAKQMIEEIAQNLNKIKNLSVEVAPVKSEYWGQDITVAGLITTDDLIRTVKNIDCDMVVIPSIMLRPYSEDFLDGKNLDFVKSETGKNFLVQKNIYSLKEVVDFIKAI
jgi:NifB/MoaA-like Fe-S oxidoreductase